MTMLNSSKDYAEEKKWHGLACYCGGGYRIGHPYGCEGNNAEDTLAQLNVDLERAKANNDVAVVTELNQLKTQIEQSI